MSNEKENHIPIEFVHKFWREKYNCDNKNLKKVYYKVSENDKEDYTICE